MKSMWNKVKQFLLTPYGKAYLVLITLTKLYLVYKWALTYVKEFGGEAFNIVGASIQSGEYFSATIFTVICAYFTIKAIINIFKPSQKSEATPLIKKADIEHVQS
ncbi:hypothetical protein C9J48_07230 [Photobacterium profundum]|jgi:hypothetical protein|uniref:Uncharacterized protein n=1 Tax=Photobacterium profundum 3TCK TaxID=314280 RepID=Q1ZAA5_9GAMM|nr:hypothetical protein [Photobacterium profundum]EAS45587.1 hypothetical protein P3TCK_04401 [Photobacterium profundum 3TCK]PSV63247.1 hypothetical protein C9J48_07230 [Photobacterium profundum]